MQLAGGDLDGDIFVIITSKHADLLPSEEAEAAAYSSVPPFDLGRPRSVTTSLIIGERIIPDRTYGHLSS